ncbi:MAG: hypothetical protein JXA09_02815 [Anaerolineae bacterium]|nr:hypothetical protein [Anaerolineae bacterium]
MGIDFEWQAGDDRGGWETVAQQASRRRRRLARWVVYLALALVVGAAVGGYVALQRRYELAYQQIVFQIQSVIDLEAIAYACGDVALYLAQQDAEAPDWYDRQQERIAADCSGDGSLSPECAPALPAEVQDVDLRAGVAWVEVIEGDPPVRKARFYRQTDYAWVHTAPQVSFWGHAIELHYGDLIARYHKRDQPHVDPLIERIAQAYWDTCAQIGCAEDATLIVNFAVDANLAAGVVPPLTGSEWVIPSPWLSGLPAEGEWPEAQLDALAFLVARGIAAQHVRDTHGQGLSPSLVARATWYGEPKGTDALLDTRLPVRVTLAHDRPHGTD